MYHMPVPPAMPPWPYSYGHDGSVVPAVVEQPQAVPGAPMGFMPPHYIPPVPMPIGQPQPPQPPQSAVVPPIVHNWSQANPWTQHTEYWNQAAAIPPVQLPMPQQIPPTHNIHTQPPALQPQSAQPQLPTHSQVPLIQPPLPTQPPIIQAPTTQFQPTELQLHVIPHPTQPQPTTTQQSLETQVQQQALRQRQVPNQFPQHQNVSSNNVQPIPPRVNQSDPYQGRAPSLQLCTTEKTEKVLAASSASGVPPEPQQMHTTGKHVDPIREPPPPPPPKKADTIPTKSTFCVVSKQNTPVQASKGEHTTATETLSSLRVQLETLEKQIKTYQIEYQKWHQDFVKWQKQHQNHPDQKKYIDYQRQYQKMIEEQQSQLKQQYGELQKKINKRKEEQKAAAAAKAVSMIMNSAAKKAKVNTEQLQYQAESKPVQEVPSPATTGSYSILPQTSQIIEPPPPPPPPGPPDYNSHALQPSYVATTVASVAVAVSSNVISSLSITQKSVSQTEPELNSINVGKVNCLQVSPPQGHITTHMFCNPQNENDKSSLEDCAISYSHNESIAETTVSLSGKTCISPHCDQSNATGMSVMHNLDTQNDKSKSAFHLDAANIPHQMNNTYKSDQLDKSKFNQLTSTVESHSQVEHPQLGVPPSHQLIQNSCFSSSTSPILGNSNPCIINPKPGTPQLPSNSQFTPRSCYTSPNSTDGYQIPPASQIGDSNGAQLQLRHDEFPPSMQIMDHNLPIRPIRTAELPSSQRQSEVHYTSSLSSTKPPQSLQMSSMEKHLTSDNNRSQSPIMPDVSTPHCHMGSQTLLSHTVSPSSVKSDEYRPMSPLGNVIPWASDRLPFPMRHDGIPHSLDVDRNIEQSKGKYNLPWSQSIHLDSQTGLNNILSQLISENIEPLSCRVAANCNTSTPCSYPTAFLQNSTVDKRFQADTLPSNSTPNPKISKPSSYPRTFSQYPTVDKSFNRHSLPKIDFVSHDTLGDDKNREYSGREHSQMMINKGNDDQENESITVMDFTQSLGSNTEAEEIGLFGEIMKRPSCENTGIRCPFMPKCTSGNKCKYGHPTCLANKSCGDPECPFEHSIGRDMDTVKANQDENSTGWELMKPGPAPKQKVIMPGENRAFTLGKFINKGVTAKKKGYPKPAQGGKLDVEYKQVWSENGKIPEEGTLSLFGSQESSSEIKRDMGNVNNAVTIGTSNLLFSRRDAVAPDGQCYLPPVGPMEGSDSLDAKHSRDCDDPILPLMHGIVKRPIERNITSNGGSPRSDIFPDYLKRKLSPTDICRSLSTREILQDTFPYRDLPPGAVTSKEMRDILPNDVHRRNTHPIDLSSRGLSLREKPHGNNQVDDMPPRDVPHRDMPHRYMPPRGMLPRDMPPKDIPARDMSSRDMPTRAISPRDMPCRDISPRVMPPRDMSDDRSMPQKDMPHMIMPPRDLLYFQESLHRNMPERNVSPRDMKQGNLSSGLTHRHTFHHHMSNKDVFFKDLPQHKHCSPPHSIRLPYDHVGSKGKVYDEGSWNEMSIEKTCYLENKNSTECDILWREKYPTGKRNDEEFRRQRGNGLLLPNMSDGKNFSGRLDPMERHRFNDPMEVEFEHRRREISGGKQHDNLDNCGCEWRPEERNAALMPLSCGVLHNPHLEGKFCDELRTCPGHFDGFRKDCHLEDTNSHVYDRPVIGIQRFDYTGLGLPKEQIDQQEIPPGDRWMNSRDSLPPSNTIGDEHVFENSRSIQEGEGIYRHNINELPEISNVKIVSDWMDQHSDIARSPTHCSPRHSPQYDRHCDTQDRLHWDGEYSEESQKRTETIERTVTPPRRHEDKNNVEVLPCSPSCVPPVDLKPELFSASDIFESPGRETRTKNIVIILRGVPGSGKSYIAKLIKDKEAEYGDQPPRILALDDYFMQDSEKTERIEGRGKVAVVKKQEYIYEADMEDAYRGSLLKAFNKTLDDGFFPMVIVDAINHKTAHFNQFWSDAKHKGFEVFISELKGDLKECLDRSVHKRSKEDVMMMLKTWEEAPVYYKQLDVSSLLQDASINDVEMEEAVEGENSNETPCPKKDDDEEEEMFTTFHIPKSKWEDSKEVTLAKLDGVSKRMTKDKTEGSPLLEDDDPYDEKEADMRLGKKRVRWADLEERKQIDHQKKIGFSIGMDWNIFTDPNAQIPK